MNIGYIIYIIHWNEIRQWFGWSDDDGVVHGMSILFMMCTACGRQEREKEMGRSKIDYALWFTKSLAGMHCCMLYPKICKSPRRENERGLPLLWYCVSFEEADERGRFWLMIVNNWREIRCSSFAYNMHMQEEVNIKYVGCIIATQQMLHQQASRANTYNQPVREQRPPLYWQHCGHLTLFAYIWLTKTEVKKAEFLRRAWSNME